MDYKTISNFKYQISNINIRSTNFSVGGTMGRAPDSAQSGSSIDNIRRTYKGRALAGGKIVTGPAEGNWKFRQGLSLVELIAGLGIIGFIILMIASVYLAHTRLFSNQNTSIEVATQNRIAVDEITNQVREGQAVVNTCPACSGDTSSSTILVLQLWPLNASSEPFEPAASAYDYIVYKRNSADNTKLIKKTIADPGSLRKSDQKIIAVDISDLQFTYEPDNNDPPTATTVSVSVTTALTSGGKTHTTTQSVKAVLRNK